MFRFASDGIGPLSQTVDFLTARRTDPSLSNDVVSCRVVSQVGFPDDPGNAQWAPPA